MRGLTWAIVLVLALASAIARGAEPPLPGEYSRRVLALYDSTEPVTNSADTSFCHRLLEMPLNHFGMAVDYWDVNNRPLPDTSSYRGIVVWFSDNALRDPAPYLGWLIDAMRRGTRVLAIGGFGADVDLSRTVTPEFLIDRVYLCLGLRRDRNTPSTENPFVIEYTDLKPELFGYETAQAPRVTYFVRYVKAGDDVRVWREVKRKDIPDSSGVAVMTSDRGGFAINPGVILAEQEINDNYHSMWKADPFRLVHDAFDCDPVIHPDVTTAFGRRAAFAHVDGDGYGNLSRDVPPGPKLCPRVMIDEVFKRYPVPITVGLIVGHVDRESIGSAEKLAIAREIHSLPNIQAGCHGWAHPLDWEEKEVGLKIPGYTFSLAKECRDSMRFLQKEVLNGRKVEVFQWTGNCMPSEEALKIVEAEGVLNLNGGHSRPDVWCTSMYHISSIARPVGSRRQIYAAAQNEYEFTREWHTNFGGYEQILDVFKRTESPRLLPVNVYHHIYSTEYLAALKALQHVYEWCLTQPLCWIHTSEYIRSALDWHKVRVGRTRDGGHWVRDYGACQTVRLDKCDRHVDMERSENVLGYNHHAGSLYVTLAPAERAVVRLTDAPPVRPCLRASTSALRNVSVADGEWKAEARLYAPGTLALRGVPAKALVTAQVGKKRSLVAADENGCVTLTLQAGLGEWVPVSARF